MKVAYDDGLIITQDQLRINVEETKKIVGKAYADSFALSLSVAYPTRENAEILIQMAHREAYSLAINAAVPTKETMKDLIRKAYVEMLSLNNYVKNVKNK